MTYWTDAAKNQGEIHKKKNHKVGLESRYGLAEQSLDRRKFRTKS